MFGMTPRSIQIRLMTCELLLCVLDKFIDGIIVELEILHREKKRTKSIRDEEKKAK